MTDPRLPIADEISQVSPDTMQKRRAPAVLPMTEGDVNKGSSNATASSQNKVAKGGAKGASRRAQKAWNKGIWSVVKLVSGMISLGFAVVLIQRHVMLKRLSSEESDATPTEDPRILKNLPRDFQRDTPAELPLQRFHSLKYALDNSHVVGLYFAASWCKMSTPVTNMMDEYFSSHLLPPPKPDAQDKLPERRDLSIVYISSDIDADQMKQYIRTNWMVVPFESEQRNNLKRHFRTCAKREMSDLGIDRLREIPTLIILSGETHEVLTYDGVKDVKEDGVEALDHWLELEGVTRSLSSKYK